MSRAPRRSAERRTLSTLLAAALIVGLAVVAVLALGRAELAPLVGGSMPMVAYQAYRSASDAASTVAGSCAVHWSVLAGIGQVESRHGRMDGAHQVAADGDVTPPIRGRALDGAPGTQIITDTDGGELDGDATWDRAMGPLQFIPTTWRELGRDGNGDGAADPDNMHDASLTAVAHLCLREPGDYADRVHLRRALLAYNPSGRYADTVLRWIDRYQTEAIEQIVERSSSEA